MEDHNKLSPEFVVELIKLMLVNEKALTVCSKYLKYQYLPLAAQKNIIKTIIDTHTVTTKAPTLGVIQQTFTGDKDVLDLLVKVKNTSIDPGQYDDLLRTFEVFIKDSRFRILYDRIGDLYNEGKQKEAIELLAKESGEINEFQIKDTYYTKVFGDYQDRQEKRIREQDSILLEKLTFGIHACDDVTRGGFNKGTSALVLARSGGGKSTMLRWVGLCNARLGRRVVHFQAEGTEKECLDAYDAGWTSISLHDIEFGNIPSAKKGKILKAQKDIIAGGGEIFVYASEKFDSMSIDECREILKDIENIYGPVDLTIFDYLEIFTSLGRYGSSEASERKRREDVANKITNIAVEFKCGTITATQAVDIKPEKYNSEDYVMTRSDISEFKGCVKPFSYFITINQTDDEYEEEIVRLCFDKIRKYKKPAKPIRMYQSRNNGRFYNAKKTIMEGLYEVK